MSLVLMEWQNFRRRFTIKLPRQEKAGGGASLGNAISQSGKLNLNAGRYCLQNPKRDVQLQILLVHGRHRVALIW